MRWRFRDSAWQGLALAVIALLGCLGNTVWHEPPRFDGAGYSVLALSLLQGQGYRGFELPQSLPHTHYPPGYPLALAAWWSLFGASAESAHALSLGCTVLAVLLTWAWFRRFESSAVAWWLGLALALNWRWQRDGAVIRSEPLYQLLTALVLLAISRVSRARVTAAGITVGLLAGLAALTRHIGLMLAAAAALELWLRRRPRMAATAAAITGLLFAPWVRWVWISRQPSQLDLLEPVGLARRFADQTLFYLRRIPDQLTGPFVEVGTVFRPELTAAATLWGVVATLLVLAGWLRMLRHSRRRLGALVPLITFPILAIWPFTEAGRFLIPLVPFILLAASEALTWALKYLGVRPSRTCAAALLAAATLPYSIYSALSGRVQAESSLHGPFDAACAWINSNTNPDARILTRFPGDLYWQTRRHAVGVPESASPRDIARRVEELRIDTILIEGQRFANETADPLEAFVAQNPAHWRRVWFDRGSKFAQPTGRAIYQRVPADRSASAGETELLNVTE